MVFDLVLLRKRHVRDVATPNIMHNKQTHLQVTRSRKFLAADTVIVVFEVAGWLRAIWFMLLLVSVQNATRGETLATTRVWAAEISLIVVRSDVVLYLMS